MNYGWILGLLAIICSVCNATIHSLPYDEKKGALHGTAGEDRKNQNETLPEGEILLQKILRNRIPRYDVSVIYLKIQDYQILCIVNLVLIYPFFVGRFFRFSLIPIWYHCIVIVIKKFRWKYFFFMFNSSF